MYKSSYGVWEKTLLKDRDLSENAKGFLLSYLWLIRQKSDFVIAQRENLVSNDLVYLLCRKTRNFNTFLEVTSMAIIPIRSYRIELCMDLDSHCLHYNRSDGHAGRSRYDRTSK